MGMVDYRFWSTSVDLINYELTSTVSSPIVPCPFKSRVIALLL